MRRQRWQMRLGVSLVVLSALIYAVHYAVFHDVHHIFIYLLGDIAFVPIEVLLVTLIVHQLLAARERRARLEKLNMVIGMFFSEVGTNLLAVLSDADPGLDAIRSDLVIDAGWTHEDYERVAPRLRAREYAVDVATVNLPELRDLLAGHRDFLLRLLENPNLLEHESFTELLQAVFHMTEELVLRDHLVELPESDLRHISGDLERAYSRLVGAWLDYMHHLRDNYPYIFSLAMRMNPFDRDASPVVAP